VTSTPSLPDLAHAALTVTVQARNLDTVAHAATITGEVAGVSLRQTIQLAPGQTQAVTFSPGTDPALTLSHPEIWWPCRTARRPTRPARASASAASARISRSRAIASSSS